MLSHHVPQEPPESRPGGFSFQQLPAAHSTAIAFKDPRRRLISFADCPKSLSTVATADAAIEAAAVEFKTGHQGADRRAALRDRVEQASERPCDDGVGSCSQAISDTRF